ncbi:CHASE3 domain-containing protein [Streptomyces sp. NPDC057694]|uniref:CHASE3 domain-containing protein n=1 Tax=Streptomyces sp. NPDC057694 TaxID=3346216 RepID=UPI003677A0C5
MLALFMGIAFMILIWAIDDANDSTSARRASRTALVEAETLERLVLDLETGQRGFVMTRQESFLQPWNEARKHFTAEARRFVEGTTSSQQRRSAVRITAAVKSLLYDYSIPLVAAVRRDDPAAFGLPRAEEGKRQVDALRAQFDRYMADERAQLAAREDAAGINAHRAVVAAGLGLAGTVALVAAFTLIQHRAVVRPVREVAAAAQRLAGGDLTVRITPSKVAEIGALGTSFNTMAASLQDSRRRIMQSVEEVHRRTARDLHDGAQQRLVSLMIGLRLVGEMSTRDDAVVTALLEDSIANAQTAIDELRELARGIYPLTLTIKGLAGAVEDLAARCPVPVVVDNTTERRLPSAVESNAYFVIAEAVTNAVKHAQASRIEIGLHLVDGVLRVRIADDGVGGVQGVRVGSGLIGLADRVAAFDGELSIESPAGEGTSISFWIPVQT